LRNASTASIVGSTTALLLSEFLTDLVEDDAVVFSFNDPQVIVRTPRPRTLLALWQEEGVMRLQVSDDGRGFSPLTVDTSRSFGLQLCRERVELAGGAMAVETSPGQGTRVHFRLPIDGE
jgi:signal transduction histidine kinase